MRKRSLGRGLSELLSGDSPPHSRTVVEIPLDEIQPNPNQPRREMHEESLQELAASIEEHGILQPILVRRRGGAYELVAGERRWRAAQRVGLDTISCLVQDIDDRTSLQVALIENLQRDDLNDIELATGYRQLLDDFGLTQEELAQRIGKSRSAVTNTLRLLELPNDIQDAIRSGRISAGHGRALLGLAADPEKIEQIAQRIADEDLSVRQVEQMVRELAEPETVDIEEEEEQQEPPTRRQKQEKDVLLADAEERLQTALATKVNIKPRSKGGTIEIQYFDDEDLSRLVDAIDSEGGFL
ncbi:MAG: ParB/RepB/Spo0J family partition protein [Armatimonadota bacterium]